ncbi:HNH endonuclease signature motif containing protein [Subtercola lobariae]|uniref:DUF222 domain-containing protein n=1 Tax=Subtercola lobariae TaxID=1588641 RepID=A0A917F0S4_9MICO|nr:HNH endonuclease signature motif containing protein [Subtercola lobariae]GGF31432.1 hypothetical protein GCM10011399_25740 [Subtercola lobariae]
MNRALLTEYDFDEWISETDVVDFVPPSLLRDVYAEAVDAVFAGARAIAAAQAEQAERVERARLAGIALRHTDRSTGGPRWSTTVVADRELVTELAVGLRLCEADARRLVETSRGLVGAFAATHAALDAGTISYRHAEKIVQRGLPLPAELIADYEARIVPVAERVSVQRLDREARGAVEVAQPSTAVQRHLAAAANRRIDLEAGADGMAYLTHYLPAVEAMAIYTRATELARSLKNAGDPRTLTQLRADALTDLMLNGETSIPGATRGIRPHVRVTVPALTLLGGGSEGYPGHSGDRGQSSHTGRSNHTGQSDGPGRSKHTGGFGHSAGGSANLEGYGPIDRLTALELTRSAPGFLRVLTDPVTGVALSYGRERYRPPADLDELIRLTHAECTFPLSCAPSSGAELDHTTAWEDDGHTAFGNLAPLCSSHHKVKHHTEWKIEQHPGADGRPSSIVWTSPAGFEYVVDPTPLARPAPYFSE